MHFLVEEGRGFHETLNASLDYVVPIVEILHYFIIIDRPLVHLKWTLVVIGQKGGVIIKIAFHVSEESDIVGAKVTDESFELVLRLRRSCESFLILRVKQLIDCKLVRQCRENLEQLSRSQLRHVLIVEGHADDVRVRLLDFDGR